MRLRLAFIVFGLIVSASPSQAAGHVSIRTAPGKPVRLGYYSVFHKDCSAGAAPTIRVTQAPKGGVVIVQQGTLTTERLQNCPKVSAPTRQIIYNPNVSFTGSDEVAFDVVDPATGQAESHSVTVTVEGNALKI